MGKYLIRPLLKAKDVAQILRVSISMVYKMQKNGNGPKYIVLNSSQGKPCRRYYEDDIYEYIENLRFQTIAKTPD